MTALLAVSLGVIGLGVVVLLVVVWALARMSALSEDAR
jgi:hypothetical protein